MNFSLFGKAEEVFGKLAHMNAQAEAGGNIIYEGIRKDDRPVVIRVQVFADSRVDARHLDTEPSKKLWNHSPDGFNWGYHGSGPAQLALALLFDAVGDEQVALRYHQDFKRCFVAAWQDAWSIDASQIKRWIELRRNYDRMREGERKETINENFK